MNLGVAQALALVAHGDAWLRAAHDAAPPSPCSTVPALARQPSPRFAPTRGGGPIARAEGPWYRRLRDRGATRLRLTTAPWPTRRAAATGAPAGDSRPVPKEGAALLVTYPDRRELWIPTWRWRPAARGRMAVRWAVTYKGQPGDTPPRVPDVPVPAASAALGATLAATLRDLRAIGDERLTPPLEEAQEYLCAASPPPCPRPDLLPASGYGDGAWRLLAAAATILHAGDDPRPWPAGAWEFYEETSELLHAAAFSALVVATNAGSE